MADNKKNRKNDDELKKDKGMKEQEDFPSDILGSYTGVPADGGKPIQDADDL